MFVISKDFHLSYAHQLAGLPDDHQCARLHGHNAIVRITLAAPALDEVGFVLDYGDLKPLGQYLDDNFDHRNISELLDFNPTAELLCVHLWDWCRDHYPQWPVAEVAWSETPKSWAMYRGRGIR